MFDELDNSQALDGVRQRRATERRKALECDWGGDRINLSGIKPTKISGFLWAQSQPSCANMKFFIGSDPGMQVI